MAVRVGFAAVLEGLLVAVAPWPLSALAAWVAACTAVVAAAMALGRPGALGKRSDGRIPWGSYVVFWPWHLLSRGVAWLNRRLEPTRHEVAPGWWLGGWPHRADAFSTWPAVIDLTNELPRRVPPGTPYLSLPVWDGTPVPAATLTRAAAWGAAQARLGPVFVHCAAGHARSAVTLAAVWAHVGVAPDPEAALHRMRRARPTVRPTVGQREALASWWRERATGAPPGDQLTSDGPS